MPHSTRQQRCLRNKGSDKDCPDGVWIHDRLGALGILTLAILQLALTHKNTSIHMPNPTSPSFVCNLGDAVHLVQSGGLLPSACQHFEVAPGPWKSEALSCARHIVRRLPTRFAHGGQAESARGARARVHSYSRARRHALALAAALGLILADNDDKVAVGRLLGAPPQAGILVRRV